MTTIKCKIYPDQAHSILRMLAGGDQPPVSFVVAEKGVQAYYVELDAWVDGAPTAHTLKLYVNGTWELFAKVPVRISPHKRSLTLRIERYARSSLEPQ